MTTSPSKLAKYARNSVGAGSLLSVTFKSDATRGIGGDWSVHADRETARTSAKRENVAI
jgi:hypothetical protein